MAGGQTFAFNISLQNVTVVFLIEMSVPKLQ